MSRITRRNEPCRTYKYDMSPIWMSHVAYTRQSFFDTPYGLWPRVTGSLRNQGSFANAPDRIGFFLQNSRLFFILEKSWHFWHGPFFKTPYFETAFSKWGAIHWYGVATSSRLLKMIGLFCKRALQNRQYSVKETFNFKEPTNAAIPYQCIAPPYRKGPQFVGSYYC